MSKNLSRRELLQWTGLVAAGVMLSPTPFAAIDDLTIRTQTHGRSRPLPQGALGRTRRHCPGCARACAVDVLTVGGAPYLCVPARTAMAAPGAGCALLPALHQIALHPRRATGAMARTGFGQRALPAGQGADLLVDWLQDLRREDSFASVALVDLSGRPPLGRPVDVLAAVLEGATLVERDDGYGWLDRLGAECGLGDGLALGLDAQQLTLITPLEGMDADRTTDTLQLAAGPVPRALAIRPDGAGLRSSPELETRVLLRARAAGAIGSAMPVFQRPWPAGAHLDAIADGSLSLLLVDASRAVCAIPWQRLRRKLRPGHGRLVVWSAQNGAAFAMADLALPAPAVLEVDEIVGGDRAQPRPGLALSSALHVAGCPDCGPVAIASRLGAVVQPPARRLAQALVEAGSGRLEAADGDERPVATLEVGELERALDSGAVWRAEPVEFALAASAGGPPPLPRQRAPWIAFEGAPVVASGEPLPPVLSKITREFATWRREGEARAHPETLATLGVDAGDRRSFRTPCGTLQLLVHADETAPRGAIVAALGFGGDCFGDDPQRRRQEPVLATLDFDPQLDPPDACAVQEVM